MNKKTRTRVIATMCTGLMIATCGLSSCAPKVEDTEETLEVFIAKLGYGSAWCEKTLNAFKEQDWVKEKYPNLNIIFESSADRSAIDTRLAAGEGRNTVDLIMSDGINAMGVDRSGKEYSCNLTDVVYNTQVPGEDITVYEKLLDPYKKSVEWFGVGESVLDEREFKSYDFHWQNGFMSILYNDELLAGFGYEEPPRTTDEFVEACQKISGDQTYGKGYAIMWSGEANYWGSLFPVWWGQYEGYDNYSNYWNGVFYDGRNYIEKSNKVFEQVGRKESMNVMTQIMAEQKGYMYTYGNSTKFKAAQKSFINGDGIFMACGDYFANEMEEDIKNSQYSIRIMRVPVVSAIINKTPTINDDATLRTVISRIDANCETAADAKAYTAAATDADISGVSEADYKTILDARSIIYATAPGSHTCIPVYAEGKQVAFDFLRFLATDIAQEIYMEATGGASLPFKYDVKEKKPELFENFYDMEKDIYTYQYETIASTVALPSEDMYPLHRLGSLPMWSAYGLNRMSIVTFPMSGGDAQAAWERDIENWQANNSKLWIDALTLAGLN